MWAEGLLDRLNPVMSVLSIIFVLVVLGESLADQGSSLSVMLAVVGWVLWAIFVIEFVARLVVAPDTTAFLKRNWWQVLFLVLPFLRIFRLVRSLRLLRSGRVLTAAVRTSHSAQRVLGSRVGWISALSGITVLGSSQLLYEFSEYERYGEALHAAAMAAISGEPLARPDTFARVVETILAIYSVVVFAALAGALGAFFTESRQQVEPLPVSQPSVD